jgi:hypothetical protein
MNLSTFTRMIYLAAMAGLLAMSLAGCHRDRGREEYRYEHGDRIDSRGHRATTTTTTSTAAEALQLTPDLRGSCTQRKAAQGSSTGERPSRRMAGHRTTGSRGSVRQVQTLPLARNAGLGTTPSRHT